VSAYPYYADDQASWDQGSWIQTQSWRDRSQPAPEAEYAEGYGADAQAPPPAAPGAGTVPASRARILFQIQPGDASVYLNDGFAGTGEELSTLARGMQVPPGQHTITVSRPGMKTEEQTVVVGPGKSETVVISLRP